MARQTPSISARDPGATRGHYQIDEDIEFLSEVRSHDASTTTNGSSLGNSTPAILSGKGKWFTAFALAAALGVGGWFALNSGSAEQRHDNWKHVAAATEASNQQQTGLTHISAVGESTQTQTIEFSHNDRDFVTTAAIRQALYSYDVNAATAALQSAQQISTGQDPEFRAPEIKLGSQLESDIKRNRQEFFKVHVFDCCDEDGDVVDILINDQLFATVPITHKGTTLSIPLQRGSNTLTLRGVKDGQGGITVSFATSQGNYFCRAMQVGEQYTMGVVAR